MIDVVFLFPQTGVDIGGTITPPFSLMAASSFLFRDGYRIKIIDQRIDKDWQKNVQRALKDNPLYVGITCMTGSQIYYALEMARFVRRNNPDIKIVWGGPHPTVMTEQTLQDENVDLVVKGEGEETCLELAKAIKKNKDVTKLKGVNMNPSRKFLNMNKLPDMPWELIDVEEYISKSLYNEGTRMLDIGETSRGCPFLCGFCCNSHMKKGIWRPMTAEKTIKMIVNDVTKFNLDSIWIRDDNFYVDLKRNEEIFKCIIKEKLDIKWYIAGTRINTFNQMSDEFIRLMKKSGGDILKFGAESGSDRILKLINKGQTKQDILAANKKSLKYDLIPCYSFMGGFPLETMSEFMETIDLMIKLPKENPKAIIESLSMFTPHPPTPLFQLSLKYGLKPPTKLDDWAYYSFNNKSHAPWLSEKQKENLKDIVDICIYGGNLIRVLDTIKNPFERALYKSIFFPINKYYKYKWENKKFGHDPLLKLIRFARKIKEDKTISL
jgi:radical SAM superfamily enzyme YgiQ (UPF0313 family)